MIIKTLEGHLTNTNKKHLKAMFEAKVMSAKVNRINYFITFQNNIYTCINIHLENNGWGKMIEKRHKATFIIG
jgi:hypothetical protein